MPTGLQHLCQTRMPAPLRSHPSRRPSGKGSVASRLGAPHIGRKNRRREADAAGVIGGSFAIAHTGLAYGNRSYACHHLALGQMAVTDNAAVALASLQISISVEEIHNLGLDRMRKQRMRSIAQDFGELIGECSWLNQFRDGIVRHGISLLQWRSGGFKHPHDMPPYRFTPSPTFGHSSRDVALALTHGHSVSVAFRFIAPDGYH